MTGLELYHQAQDENLEQGKHNLKEYIKLELKTLANVKKRLKQEKENIKDIEKRLRELKDSNPEDFIDNSPGTWSQTDEACRGEKTRSHL